MLQTTKRYLLRRCTLLSRAVKALTIWTVLHTDTPYAMYAVKRSRSQVGRDPHVVHAVLHAWAVGLQLDNGACIQLRLLTVGRPLAERGR